jgi:hypothetical protein
VADALERRESDGILRAGAIVGGLAITTAGYAVGAIRGRIRGWGPSVETPSP